MKKLASLVMATLVFCTILSLNGLAAEDFGSWLESVDFSKNNNAVYVINTGEISATANIAGTVPANSVMVTAVYTDSSKKRLTSVSYNPITASSGAFEGDSVTVSSTSEEVCVYFLNSATLSPVANPEKLNKVSRDTRISSLAIELDGATYKGYTNTDTKTTSFYVDKAVADKTNVTATGSVASGASIGKINFTEANPTVTVAAAQGNTKKYPVALCDSLTTYWDEQWTGAAIAGGVVENEKYKSEANNRYSGGAYMPTYGTWNGGVYYWNKGIWDSRPNDTDNIISITTGLSDASTNQGTDNTALGLQRVNGVTGFSFKMRPNDTLSFGVFSVDYNISHTETAKTRTRVSLGGVSMILETSGKVAMDTGNIGLVEKINEPYKTLGYWHNLTLVQSRLTGGATAAVEVYVDGAYCGCVTIKTGTGRNYALGTAYCGFYMEAMNPYSTECGTVYFDNNKILGKK